MPSTSAPCPSTNSARELIPFVPVAGLRPVARHAPQITPLIRERMKLLRDVQTVADFFFTDQLPPYDPAELIPKKGDAPWPSRPAARRAKSSPPPNSLTMGWKPLCAPPASNSGIKAGQMFEPIRVAVCGRKNAPPLFDTLEVLGRETCLARIAPGRSRKAIGHI